MNENTVLEAKNITKIFPGVVALDSISIAVELGKIHCIVGENGAGKSTLIKCLTGVHIPERGEVYIRGQKATRQNKLFSKVAYVPQEIDLFKNMSVAENLFIPYERSGLQGFVSHKVLRKRAAEILKKFNIDASPDALVRDISVSQQQLLQIARATVFEGYEVLLLDEPTTSLTQEDTEKLFETIEQLKKENKAIVFISHKLEEVFHIGDNAAVFRNGRQVANTRLSDVDVPWIIKQMTGRVLDEKELFASENVTSEILLEVENLSGESFRNVSFKLKKGEILGFCGLIGAGRSEVMQAIFGCLPAASGSVRFDGKPWKLGHPSYSVENGLFYLPEERRSQGILPELSVRANTSISILKEITINGFISKKKEDARASEIVNKYDIKTPTLGREIKFLSGGNQQKVIIGRFMSCKPKLLIFDEPTKGIDVGTKNQIYRLMKQIAKEGVAIILISSEMNEVQKCSNRIISMYNGKINGEHSQNADSHELLHSILGLNEGKSHA
ncbi:sugar ABC transporter ATP-binding protein [Spirochaetia bacterium]|nr:sugar ABC transporter ATP-binding protein [Spirochaetia bacterium]